MIVDLKMVLVRILEKQNIFICKAAVFFPKDLTPGLSCSEDDCLLAIERLPGHDGSQRSQVNVSEPVRGQS
jgi:hypothetical protein